GRCATEVGAAGHLSVSVPVTDHQSVELHPAFEHVRKQPMVAVHPHALPTRERGHDALNARGDGWRIPRSVNVTQLRFARTVVALVTTARAPVPQKVLG